MVRHPALILLVCSCVSSCGFQLRGSSGVETTLPAMHVTVGDRYGDLHQNLIRSIARSGGSVVDDVNISFAEGSAPYSLVIGREKFTRRAIATTSTISVAEYELRLEVEMKLVNRARESVIPQVVLVSERIYTFDSNSLVGSNEEEALLLREMRSDLVLQIVRRVGASVRSFEAGT